MRAVYTLATACITSHSDPAVFHHTQAAALAPQAPRHHPLVYFVLQHAPSSHDGMNWE